MSWKNIDTSPEFVTHPGFQGTGLPVTSGQPARGFHDPGAAAGPPASPVSGFQPPAQPGGAPMYQPTAVSQGGSMVMGKGPTGVEEIRGTGRPSWQVYHGAGVDEQYPAAVASWKTGLAHEQGATERAEIAGKAHVEGSAAAAKNPYYDALAGKVKAETKILGDTGRKADIATGQATLRKQLEEEVGVPDAQGKNLSLPTDPGFQSIHKKMDRLTMQGVSPEEAYKAVAPELHKHYYTPENLYGAISLMEKQTGQPMDPETRKEAMAGTPRVMELMYPYTRQAAQQPRGVVARTFNPAPAIGPAGTQPAPPAAVPAPAPTTFRSPAVQPFAGAAEQGEGAGAPAGQPMDLGPGWGKPLGGATLPNRY